jgi:uncharacterized phage-like protein YoqJ
MNNDIKDAIDKFEKLQSSYSRYGASDTEPDGQFHWIIKKAINNEDVNFEEMNADKWELFSGEKGVGLAAHHMTKQSKKVYDLIKTKANVSDIEELKNYAWRCF